MPGPYHIVRASAAASTAINTAQAATNDSLAVSVGAITVPSDLAFQVPGAPFRGAITQLSAAFNISGLTATGIGTAFTVRLTGNGLYLTQDIVIVGFTSIVTAPGQIAGVAAGTVNLLQIGGPIPVIPNNQISVQLFAVGGAIAVNWSGAVELVFS